MARPHGTLILCGFLLTSLITGAVLAPWLFKAGGWFVNMVNTFHWDKSPVLGWLSEQCARSDFTRFFNRSMLVGAVVWLWPFLRWAGVRRDEIGLERNRFRWQDGAVGFIMGSGLLLVMGFMFINGGRFAAKPGVAVGSLAGMALFAAFCVALMEEWFFRAGLFGLLLRTMRPLPALFFLSGFFSIIHLLQPPDETFISPADVNAGSGFWVIGQIFAKFGNANFLLAEGATLFAVGLILGWSRLRTRSLWLGIGLHAGWVFGIKFFAGLTRTPKGVNGKAFMPWIGDDLKTGLVPLMVLSFTGLLVAGWFVLRRKAIATLPREYQK